ncbi:MULTISPECIES: general stress protein [Listeria]|uniref:general stress protein n=1 Tax=Listeria TaxID=1637 RepID=UPI000B58D425|nr:MULTISPECIES: general stress protein [Listeria]
MDKWEVLSVENEEEAVKQIEQLVQKGYTKEDISVLAKNKKMSEEIAERTETEQERPVNEEAFGIISGILQSLSGAIVIPQAYNPKYGALYAAGPFAKWFSRTNDKTVKRLLEDFDLTDEQIAHFVSELDEGKLLLLAR